jgi:GNAT superfamily N-acetyltransferase
MAIEIRQANRTDSEPIQAFIREAYGPLAPYKGMARWKWQFIDNPVLPNPEDELPVWIATDGDKVVGQIALQRTALHASGHTLQAGWIVDVMILPTYRGQKIGHRLYEAIAGTGLVLLTLTMADATRRMAERLGAIALPRVYRFTRWRAPDSNDVARYLLARTQYRKGWSRLAKILNAIGCPRPLALTARAVSAFQDLRADKDNDVALRFEPIDRFDASIDEIWASHAASIAGVPRTHEHLNWRFVDCPQLTYERFLVTLQRQRVGYIVLRRSEAVELRQGFIVDALLHAGSSALWPNLFRLAFNHFGNDFASVEAAASGLETSQALRNSGFFRTKSYTPTIVCRDRDLLRELQHVRNWFFNKGDHDWDQIHLA